MAKAIGVSQRQINESRVRQDKLNYDLKNNSKNLSNVSSAGESKSVKDIKFQVSGVDKPSSVLSSADRKTFNKSSNVASPVKPKDDNIVIDSSTKFEIVTDNSNLKNIQRGPDKVVPINLDVYKNKSNFVDTGKGSIPLIDINTGKEKSVEEVVKGIGQENITNDTILKSLEQKGITDRAYIAKNNLIASERNRLDVIAATPSQRTGMGYAFGGLAGASIAAPAVLVGGPATLGLTLARGIGTGTFLTSTAVPAAKTTFDVFVPSSLSPDERIKAYQIVEKRVGERFAKEGNTIPFIGGTTQGFAFELVKPSAGGIFGEEYEKYFIEKGKDIAEAKRLASIETSREIFAGGAAEIPAFWVGGGAVGEITGAATQKGLNVFTKIGTKPISKTAATIYSATSGAIGGFVGGAAETAVIYPAFQTGRYREVKPEEYKAAIIGGGVTAGLAGALIGGLVTKPTAQKFTYGALGVSELGQEFVGDFGAKKLVGDAFDSGLIINGMEKINTPNIPIVNINLTPNQIFTPTKNNTQTPTFGPTPIGSNVGIGSNNLSSFSNSNNIFTPTKSHVINVSNTSDYIGTTSDTTTQIPTKGKKPTITITDTTTQTPTNTETPEPTPEQIFNITNTTTQTPTYTLTPTKTNTPTITAPFFPIGFPSIGLPSGSGKKDSRIKRKYLNEFAQAKQTFKEFNKAIFNPFIIKKTKKKRR